MFRVTDQRVIEACRGRSVDVETATPEARFEAYCQWTLPSITSHEPGWGRVLLDVAKGCGFKIN
jgi:hypothetical protein